MDTFYSKGEVVWAKVAGFPWWPGVIKSVFLKHRKTMLNEHLITTYEDEPKALIEFIGDYSHVVLPLKKIEKFIGKFKEYSQLKHIGVQSAIDKAKRMYMKRVKGISSALIYDFLGKKRIRTIAKERVDCQEKRAKGHLNKAHRKRRRVMRNKRAGSRRKEDDDFIEVDLNDDEEDETYEEEESEDDYEDSEIEDDAEEDEEESHIDLSFQDEDNALCDNDNKEDNNKNRNSKSIRIKKRINQKLIKPKPIIKPNTISITSKEDTPSKTLAKDTKDAIDQLLKIKVEKRTKESFKHIIDSLDRLAALIRSNKSNCTYSLTKDLMPILTSFTMSNNKDIFHKSFELVQCIKDQVIAETFDISKQAMTSLIKKNAHKANQIGHMPAKARLHFIEQLNHTVHSNQPKQVTPKPKKYYHVIEDEEEENDYKQTRHDSMLNQEKNKEPETEASADASNEDTFIGYVLKILISEEQIIQKEHLIKGLVSINYYLNIENPKEKKAPIESEDSLTLKKKACLTLYKMLKASFPEFSEEFIRKGVLFLEYLARLGDSEYGDKYKATFEQLYLRVKQLIASISSNPVKFTNIIYSMFSLIYVRRVQSGKG